MRPESEYTKQADQFLTKHGIKFRATMTADNKCPMWCDGKHIHGNRHRVTFSRNGERFQIMFWNSYNDTRDGISPTAYDVLACITKNDPEDFQTFCAEYGYDSDSRKAEKTYKAASKEWEKVSRFFSPEEVEELYEIN